VIIKGKSRNGGAALARHLSRTDTNERAEVLEVRGTVAQDLRGAFQEMEAVASGTNCQKSLYHANIDPDARFPMTREQWREAIDAVEKKMGLTDQPRAVVIHVKQGREHCHVVWSRIDTERMTAISDGHNYRKHEEVCRDLERRFGHERVQGAHAEREGKERPERTPHYADIQQQERHGKRGRAAVDAVKQVKADITALWHSTDSGKDFAAGLAARGYVLAQGDRNDFVVLDSVGAVHSVARRIEGVKTAAVRTRMADIDRASLPTLEQARASLMIDDHAAEKPTLTPPPAPQPTPSPAPDFRAQLDAATAQQAAREADLLAQAERQDAARRAFVAEQTDAAAKARTEEEARQRADAERERNGDLADPQNRYARALAQEYQVENPYGSLARAAMNEYGRFAQQQEALGRQIADAKTSDDRRALELRRDIEGCDYMVITSQRLAGLSRVVTGNRDSEQAQRDEATAKFYQERAAALRAERAQMMDKKRGDGTSKEPPRTDAAASLCQEAPVREVSAKADAPPRQPEPTAAPEIVREIAFGLPAENPGLTPAGGSWNRTLAESRDLSEAPKPPAKSEEPAKAPQAAAAQPQSFFAAARQRVAGVYQHLTGQAAPPAHAGEPAKTAADHAAINRTQDAEKRQREQQHQQQSKTAEPAKRGNAPPKRRETEAERQQELKELSAAIIRENAKGQGQDRGGGRSR
jgi:hypothetical protein